MEVVMRNVPKDLSDDSLRKELDPFMKNLKIQDWGCEKPRKRPQAWVIFLSEVDGKKFLKSHEKVPIMNTPRKSNFITKGTFNPNPKSRAMARLHIVKTPIYVEKSDRTVDRHMLKHLEYMKENRKPEVSNLDHQAPAVSASIKRLACGKNIFTAPSNTLTFVEQSRFHCSGVAKFGRRSLTMNIDDRFRVDIPYNIIQDLIAGPSGSSLTLVLTEPPRMYSKAEPEGTRDQFVKWKREAHLDSWAGHAKYVAHCLVYQVKLGADRFTDTVNSLKSRDLLSVTRQHLPAQLNPRPFEEDYTTCMNAFEGQIRNTGIRGKSSLLPYPILFQVQALVSNNYLHPASARTMLDVLESFASRADKLGEELPFTTSSIKQLFHKIPYPCPGIEPQQLLVEELVSEVLAIEEALRAENGVRTKVYGETLPDSQAWVLKAMVTPTRILLHGPDAESKNRVLRLFPSYTDYFIRVTFCDEDGQDLAFSPKIDNSEVFRRYKKVLSEGIQIASRRFEFLGFSHSSLRSHSTWFSAPFIDNDMSRQDYNTIISSLGDFRNIRIPAKCAARIGQAFSETPYVVPIMASNIRIQWIPDIKTDDGSRVFSDGVGTISWDAMEDVWDHLPMSSKAPTCFQVRLAGVKGMLALDTRLKGKVICLRKESMRKFESNDFEFMGICDAASRPLRMVLNRQLIKILEDMGTAKEWFIEQQNKALRALRGVTATAANTSTFLEFQLVGTNVGLPKLIKSLNRMGIDYRRDRFMKSVVEHVVMRELRLLKHKARIPIDKGVTLFGVVDETGFLKEGEVYITYDQDYDKIQGRVRRSLADGHVIITRSPALHPGDIQYVQMVTPPEGHPLRHLKNCIIFSQHGDRDLPSQLSGGDLDGDLYSVIWDPDAHPHHVYGAADYPRVVPESLDRDVTRDDITDFFINFMETDILGLIANRHQIIADIKPNGTVDSDCIQLAEMHSTAVDFSKTGIPVTMRDMPRAPRTRPDFLAPAPPLKLYDVGQISHIGDHEVDDDDDEDGMGMAKHKFHKSEKILGELYRSVDEKRIWNHDVHRPIDMTGPSVWEQLLEKVQAFVYDVHYGSLIDHRRKVDDAWKIRFLYENAISENMWHFSDNPRVPITEVEAFCGSILNKTGSQTRKQRDSSIKLKEEIDEVMNWTVKMIRDRSGGGGAGHDDESESVAGADEAQAELQRISAVELCWACVVVGCVKDPKAGVSYRGSGQLESFRAVAACCLVKELGELISKARAETGGGFVGTKSGHQQHMTLPMR